MLSSRILVKGEDFSFREPLLLFLHGAASDTQCITIDIVDDVDFEESQNFSATIISLSQLVSTVGEFAVVIIEDNNGIIII